MAIVSLDHLRGRHPRRGQARAADRPDAVGEPEVAGHQGPATCSTARRARRASSASSCSRRTSFDPKTVVVPRHVHARSARAEPGDPAHRVGSRQHRQRPARRSGRAARRADERRREERVRRCAARHPARRRSRPAATPPTSIFRTGPSGLDARAKVVREIRKTVNPPRGRPRDAVGSRGRRRRPARQPRSEPRRPHVHRDPLRVLVPRRCGCAASCARCCRSFRC